MSSHNRTVSQDANTPAEQTYQFLRSPRDGSSTHDSYGEDETFAPPTSSGGPFYETTQPTATNRKYCVIMTGPPAGGKTFLAQKLCRYLNWLGYNSQTFNVQKILRQRFADPDRPKKFSAEYFDPTNVEGNQDWMNALGITADMAIKFFGKGGQVAFLNDDFPTTERRKAAETLLEAHVDGGFVYIEAVPGEHTSRFRSLKATSEMQQSPLAHVPLSPSFTEDEKRSQSPEPAVVHDLTRRIELIAQHYDELTPDMAYIRVKSSKFIEVNGVRGYIPSRLVSYLLNLSQNKVRHPILFSRHGQSAYNLEDRLGGDPELTPKGEEDAELLGQFVKELRDNYPEFQNMEIWTSQLRRAIATAMPASNQGIKTTRWSCLNEIHAGVCENMTYQEVAEQYPLIDKFRRKSKYTFRYPDGESYQDLVIRLEPLIMELENANSVVLVVAHQAVLRALLAYFNTTPAQDSVRVHVPHRNVWVCKYSLSGETLMDRVELHPGNRTVPESVVNDILSRSRPATKEDPPTPAPTTPTTLP